MSASERAAKALAIVVPVYNEGASIEAVLSRIDRAVQRPREIVVVYDFEGDDTLPVVRPLLARVPGLKLHANHRGRGALAAIRSGIEATTAPYVVVTMADGSDDPGCIEAMASLADGGAVVVAASRYTPGGRQLGGPRWKRLASRGVGLVLHHVGGLPVRDPTNNYKLYARRFLEQVEIESRRGFELALELTVKAHAMGFALAEVPTTWVDRSAGESRFDALGMLPGYLRWFAYGLVTGLLRRAGPAVRLLTRTPRPGGHLPAR